MINSQLQSSIFYLDTCMASTVCKQQHYQDGMGLVVELVGKPEID